MQHCVTPATAAAVPTFMVLSADAEMICMSRSLLPRHTTGAVWPSSVPRVRQLKGFHSSTRLSALPEATTLSMLFQAQQCTALVWPAAAPYAHIHNNRVVSSGDSRSNRRYLPAVAPTGSPAAAMHVMLPTQESFTYVCKHVMHVLITLHTLPAPSRAMTSIETS